MRALVKNELKNAPNIKDTGKPKSSIASHIFFMASALPICVPNPVTCETNLPQARNPKALIYPA